MELDKAVLKEEEVQGEKEHTMGPEKTPEKQDKSQKNTRHSTKRGKPGTENFDK